MKRHLFVLFIFILCCLAWIVVLKGGIKSSVNAEPEATPLPILQTNQTPILGAPEATVDQAKNWSKSRGATDAFVSLADTYWEVGDLMGIRPDVLYAQASKETNFGNFGGAATTDMNNFAGIKKVNATGDTKADLETFPTPQEGVQAHFNHMAAYVGVTPLGLIDQRYYVVLSSSWAGSIKYVEELGGKWAPDSNYGMSIVNDYLDSMESM